MATTIVLKLSRRGAYRRRLRKKYAAVTSNSDKGTINNNQEISRMHLGKDALCFIRNRFIRNLVLDCLKFKKLLELQGKSRETLETSVLSFTVSETYFSSRDLEVSTAVCFMCLKANQPYGQHKMHFFTFCFRFHYFSKLRKY